MSSNFTQNSFSSKIGNFFRGMVVFLFLISIPAVALYWDHMPFGVKAGFQWARAQISESDLQTDDFSDEKTTLEPVAETQPERIFPIRQVSYDQTLSAVAPISQAAVKYELVPQNTAIRNSEIEKLEHEILCLGASQCRLEPWGKTGCLYRFSCFASLVPGEQGFQKHFQQIAATSEEAMKKVHEQILDWQARERR